MSALYDLDPYEWFSEQINLLKEKKFELLDIDHLTEELGEMGESYAKELESRLEKLFMHLLKWKYQPHKRKNGWIYTIIEQRSRVKKRLKKTPSLKHKLNEIREDSYYYARLEAASETGLDLKVFPEEMPFTFEEAMTEGWLP